MKKEIKKELLEMKYLFGYERGRVISEQTSVSMDEDDNIEGEFSGVSDAELDENKTREKERIKIDPGTKPKEPQTPYKPKPGAKPDPKAKRKGDIPEWLTFDELGIDFE